MPDSLDRSVVDAALSQLGFEIQAEEGGFVFYRNPLSIYPLELDFLFGKVYWIDLQGQLEYAHIDLDKFQWLVAGLLE